MANVTLNAAMRSNLLSLQNTAGLLAQTQQRLATGKKVNSALDNPNSYFAAQGLSNRANDLSTLLDGMGQGIQVLTAASQGLTSAASIISQMQSVANSASQSLATTNAALTNKLVVTGSTVSIGASGSSKLTDLTDSTGTNAIFAASGTFAAPGATLQVVMNNAAAGASQTTFTFTAGTSGVSLNDVVTWLNTVEAQSLSGISASIDSTGHINISASTTSGQSSAGIVINATSSVSTGTAAGATLLNRLFGGSTGTLVTVSSSAASTGAVAVFTSSAVTFGGVAAFSTGAGSGNSISSASFSQYVASYSAIPSTSSTLASLGVTTGTTLKVTLTNPSNSTLSDQQTITLGSTNTVQDLLNSLNSITGVSAQLKALNNSSGTQTSAALVITATNGQTISIDSGTAGTIGAQLGLTTQTAATASSAAPSSTFINQFDQLKTQLDQLVKDASYQGINLLSGTSNAPLKINFNNDATNPNNLSIAAVDVTSSGLGITNATGNWTNNASIVQSVQQLTQAQSSIRNQASTFGQNLTTVQTRQSFTQNLINTLQTGSDSLTNADMNQESANMLALQTQQQLGISSLSLASQAAQSVLKLFP